MAERTSRAARAQIAALEGKGFLLHASASLLDGERAVAFLASSGGGKSTLAGRLHSSGLQALADDDLAIVVRPDGRVDAMATMSFQVLFERPLATRCAPLVAICFIEKGSRSALIPLGKRYSLYRFMRSMWLPGGPDHSRACLQLDIAGRVVATVPCFTFVFDRTQDPAVFLGDSLAGS